MIFAEIMISKEAIEKLFSGTLYGEYRTLLVTSDGTEIIASCYIENQMEASIFSVELTDTEYVLKKELPYVIIFAESERNNRLLVCYIAFGLVLMIVYTLTARYLVHKPVYNLSNTLRKIQEDGEISSRVTGRPWITEFYIITHGLNRMLEKIEQLLQTVYRKEIYARDMELKQLQAQINPHFLFNSFFILKRMIQGEDFSSAVSLTDYLCEYFRYITRSEKSTVQLIDEYTHACSYLHIQQIRYGCSLKISLAELPPKLETLTVPRLILQPLFENALSYGMRQDGEIMHITLTISLNDGLWRICVSDNGNTLSEEKLRQLLLRLDSDGNTQSDVTALMNIHRRLRLFFGAPCGLTLELNSDGGLDVSILLPQAREG